MEKSKTVLQDLIEYWKIYLVENEENINSEEELETIQYFIKQLEEKIPKEKQQIEDAYYEGMVNGTDGTLMDEQEYFNIIYEKK